MLVNLPYQSISGWIVYSIFIVPQDQKTVTKVHNLSVENRALEMIVGERTWYAYVSDMQVGLPHLGSTKSQTDETTFVINLKGL